MDLSPSLRVSSTTLSLLVLMTQFLQGLPNIVPTNNQTSPTPALIVFGDSIVDPGNNNVLHTLIKSNFPPYGKDFVGHEPTGRFSNGKIPSDLLAKKLGIKEYLPAYLGTKLDPEDILTGVSFASGASGYDPLTPQLVSVISMPGQLELFKEYKEKLKAIAGEERAANIVSESLYLTCTGTDDIANTYFSTPFRKNHYDIPSYVNLMVNSASSFIQELTGLGARKIGFVGLPPVGCLPSQRTLGGGIKRDCEATRNQAAALFNSKMAKELQRLSDIYGTMIVLLDIYDILLEFIQHPSDYGFEEVTKGCCGTGLLETSVLCNSLTDKDSCEDDTKYVFWDGYHPTERAYGIVVDKICQRNRQFMLC